jgi:hypothetical protein
VVQALTNRNWRAVQVRLVEWCTVGWCTVDVKLM